MADWQYLSPEQVEHLESLVKRSCFSWVSVYERFGSSMGEMNAVRAGKRPFAWGTWIPHLEALVEAVEAVPIPPRPAYVPEGEPKPMPSPDSMINVEVLAATIGRLFLESESFSAGEREITQDAYGRLAEALGIEANVANAARSMRTTAQTSRAIAATLHNAEG
jgi:hypothetical protein